MVTTEPRATDVLANERTFLAYLRTALSFIAFGFVVARFALFTREIASLIHAGQKVQSFSTGFGTLVAVFGAFIAVYGGYRYVVTDRALKAQGVVSLSPTIAATGAIIVALVGIATGVGLVTFH